MRDVYVLGIGQTIFGKHDSLTVNDLGAAAALAAVKDAGISPKELKVAYCGTMFSPPTPVQSILFHLGADRIPMYTVENACASGSSAVHLLFQEVALGVRDVGIALGVESLSAFNKKFGKGLLAIEGDLQGKLALTMPSFLFQAVQPVDGEARRDDRGHLLSFRQKSQGGHDESLLAI